MVLDGAVALVGGILPDRWIDRCRAPLLGFAAGALLASGVGEILPEAVAKTGVSALGWMAGAMVTLGAAERVSARGDSHRTRPVAPIALLGSDALHNIGDGMAIAAAFLVSRHLGIITSAAVLVHEFPEEVADYALLRVAGTSKHTALVGLAAVQLTAGIGAAGTLLASSLLARASGVILSIAAGLFGYIGAFDLLPELVRARSRAAVVAGLIGAAVVLWLS
ncbi:MAG TPA: ZIP family metal transporter [Kofleriaceae bacterium]